jgi:hypothetical protein
VLLILLGLKLMLRPQPQLGVLKIMSVVTPTTRQSDSVNLDALTKTLQAQFGTTEPSSQPSPELDIISSDPTKLLVVSDPTLNLHAATQPITEADLKKMGITVVSRKKVEMHGDDAMKVLKEISATMPTTEP